MQINKPINVCPSTEGGKNWQAMSYNQPTGLLIVPLSQSCMEFTAREVDFSGRAAETAEIANFCRCRAPTATSASWRRTT